MGKVSTSISFNSFKYHSNSLSEALIMLYLLIHNTIGIYLHSNIIICNMILSWKSNREWKMASAMYFLMDAISSRANYKFVTFSDVHSS